MAVSPKTARKIASMAADGLDTDEIAVALGTDAATVNQVLGGDSESAPVTTGTPRQGNLARAASDPQGAPVTFSPGSGRTGGAPIGPPTESVVSGGGAPPAPPPVPPELENLERDRCPADRVGRSPGALRQEHRPRVRLSAPLTDAQIGNCEDCACWSHEPPAARGQCRRYAPAQVERYERLFTVWPMTRPENWCAEFSPRSGGGA